jgi:fucose permease
MIQLLLAIIYLSFISLGLPDALLGAGWPVMCEDFGVPLSYAGIISLIIAAGTIVSSLLSDRLTLRFGTARVTAFSVATTAVALLGFSMTRSYWILLLWAVPYGLGAGSVDASLNNYVALHYSSRHMSWLHCMWGIGASTGPYVMGYALTAEKGWYMGYRYIALIQIVLTAVLILSIPIWKARPAGQTKEGEKQRKPLGIKEILRIPGAKEVLIAFFCYCAAEQTAILWSSTYLVMHNGLDETAAASFASFYLLGLTLGRGLSGFLTIKINDTNMIRLGQGLMVLGIAMMLLPFGTAASMIGLMLIGLGCAPVYPCIIHSTPDHFGPENSQALIGVQMASAYLGTLLVPPLFGLVAQHISASLLPFFLAVVIGLMILMCEILNRKSAY